MAGTSCGAGLAVGDARFAEAELVHESVLCALDAEGIGGVIVLAGAEILELGLLEVGLFLPEVVGEGVAVDVLLDGPGLGEADLVDELVAVVALGADVVLLAEAELALAAPLGTTWKGMRGESLLLASVAIGDLVGCAEGLVASIDECAPAVLVEALETRLAVPELAERALVGESLAECEGEEGDAE